MVKRSNRFSPHEIFSDRDLLNFANRWENRVQVTGADAVRLNELFKMHILGGLTDRELYRRKLLAIRVAEAQAAYAKLIGAMLTEAEIETETEFRKILAQAFNAIQSRSLEAVSVALGKWATEAGREKLYLRESEKLVNKQFKLYLYDSAALAGALHIEGRLQMLSKHLKVKAQLAIVDCMEAAFVEAWEGVSLEAFPLEYRIALLDIIPYAASKIEITGPDIQHWEIYANFDKLFGDYGALKKGFHEGAIIESSTGTYRTIKRVKIVPEGYKDQRLKNPKVRRYLYWKAMWEGRDYTGGYEDWTKRESGKAKASREKFYTNAISNKQKEIETVEQNILSSGRDLNKRSMGNMGPTTEEKERLNLLREQKQELVSAYQNSKYFRPIDTSGQREHTIRSRMAVWGRMDLAPYWRYLEFGQLVWSPKIPPRAVRYRFYIKIRAMISEMARQLFNVEFEQVGMGRTGRYYLPSGQTPASIPFVIKSTTKPGGFLPKTLVRKAREAGEKVVRNTEWVESRFGVQTPPPSPQSVARTFSSEMEDYRQEMEKLDQKFDPLGVGGYYNTWRKTVYPRYEDFSSSPEYQSVLRTTGQSSDYLEARDFWRADKAYQLAKERVLGGKNGARARGTRRKGG